MAIVQRSEVQCGAGLQTVGSNEHSQLSIHPSHRTAASQQSASPQMPKWEPVRSELGASFATGRRVV